MSKKSGRTTIPALVAADLSNDAASLRMRKRAAGNPWVMAAIAAIDASLEAFIQAGIVSEEDVKPAVCITRSGSNVYVYISKAPSFTAVSTLLNEVDEIFAALTGGDGYRASTEDRPEHGYRTYRFSAYMPAALNRLRPKAEEEWRDKFSPEVCVNIEVSPDRDSDICRAVVVEETERVVVDKKYEFRCDD